MSRRKPPPRKHIPPRDPRSVPPYETRGPDKPSTAEEMIDEPLFTACVDLIGRTGAKDFGMRYQDDEKPVVWIALARYERGGRDVYETDAALDPTLAAFRLCERLMDGGECQHCHRPTGVSDDFVGDMPLDELFCWYRFDPELNKFRRACEGDAA